jgi:hypothetical protein
MSLSNAGLRAFCYFLAIFCFLCNLYKNITVYAYIPYLIVIQHSVKGPERRCNLYVKKALTFRKYNVILSIYKNVKRDVLCSAKGEAMAFSQPGYGFESRTECVGACA